MWLKSDDRKWLNFKRPLTALGFWNALTKVYGNTRWQRCWVHKTANVLNKLPKSLQAKAKAKLHQIWQPPEKDEAQHHFADFISVYGAKYPNAAECLKKDHKVLLTFYDFPAEHWRHIRATNPIESTFATVRLRTNKVRGCFSAQSVITMAFKLCQFAKKQCIRLHPPQRLSEVIRGAKFINGNRGRILNIKYWDREAIKKRGFSNIDFKKIMVLKKQS